MPESLLVLAGFIFAHAAWSVSDLPKGTLLIPFAVVEKSGQRQLIRFEADSQEEAVARGKAMLDKHERDIDAWGFARENQILEGNAYVDVLTIEAKQIGEGTSIVFVQRFQPFASGKFKLLGQPTVIVRSQAVSPAEAKPLLAMLKKGIESHNRAYEHWPEWAGG
jgi:hypothetical protein